MDHFTERHFELLEQWHGQKCENTNSEHVEAYNELKDAYAVTEKWAHSINEKLFHNGWVKARKRPTSQANKFESYNWARIYPSKHSPSYWPTPSG